MAKILGSLLTKYNAVITAWDSVAIADQTLQNLRQRLLKEESRLTHRDEEESAFSAESTSKNKSSKRGNSMKNRAKREFICFGCGKPGHIKANCRKKNGEKFEQNEKRALIAAFECEEDGSSTTDIFAFNTSSVEKEEFVRRNNRDVWYGDSAQDT